MNWACLGGPRREQVRNTRTKAISATPRPSEKHASSEFLELLESHSPKLGRARVCDTPHVVLFIGKGADEIDPPSGTAITGSG